MQRFLRDKLGGTITEAGYRTHLQVPFLNLIANIVERAGAIAIRLGGNTQELATLVPELDNHRATAKEDGNTMRTTDTPAVLYTKDLFYMAGNISSLVNVDWFFGKTHLVRILSAFG